jgi:hypothetical protein
MTILKIRFKRTKNSAWENGLFIEPSDVIIDSLGNIVEGLVEDFTRLHFDFCIDLTGIMNKEN